MQLSPGSFRVRPACVAATRPQKPHWNIGSFNSIKFEVVGEIANVETMTQGNGIRDLSLLRKQYGLGNWRKKKGIAQVRLPDGSIALDEVHWYEAHGIGKVKIKVKEWL